MIILRVAKGSAYTSKTMEAASTTCREVSFASMGSDGTRSLPPSSHAETVAMEHISTKPALGFTSSEEKFDDQSSRTKVADKFSV